MTNTMKRKTEVEKTSLLSSIFSWADLCDRAENAGCSELTLKAKDAARWQVHHLALEYGYSDPELAECPEDAVEECCKEFGILFDERGNIVS